MLSAGRYDIFQFQFQFQSQLQFSFNFNSSLGFCSSQYILPRMILIWNQKPNLAWNSQCDYPTSDLQHGSKSEVSMNAVCKCLRALKLRTLPRPKPKSIITLTLYKTCMKIVRTRCNFTKIIDIIPAIIIGTVLTNILDCNAVQKVKLVWMRHANVYAH